MKLKDYLVLQQLSSKQFAKLSGIPDSTIRSYVTERYRPSRAHALKIHAASQGRVTEFTAECRTKTEKKSKYKDHHKKYAYRPSPFDDPKAQLKAEPLLSPPLLKALRVLGGGAHYYRDRQVFTLWGRIVTAVEVVRAANVFLRQSGSKPIAFPGLDVPVTNNRDFVV